MKQLLATQISNLNTAKKIKQKKKRTNDLETFKVYIYKVLKNIHPQLSISKKALNIVNQLIFDIFEKIIQEVHMLVKISKKKTLKAREILIAVRLLLPGDLAKHAVSEGVQAVKRYIEY